MLRSILSKAMSSRGRGTPTGAAGRKPAPRTGAGGSANGEIARGAKSLAGGLSRKRRGV